MTLSVGAATDYVYALAQQAVAGVTVNGHPAVAVDGEPDALTFGMFVVGQSDAPPNVIGDIIVTREWASMGDRWVDENYDLPCYIDVRVPGRTLKTARDVVEGMFNTFWAALVADPTLGGALAQGHVAEVTRITFTPRNVGEEGEPGRRYVASFSVHCASTVR